MLREDLVFQSTFVYSICIIYFILKPNSLICCVSLKIDLRKFNTTKSCHFLKTKSLVLKLDIMVAIQVAAQMTCSRQHI